MKGYKAFHKGLKCKDYQYELDKTHIFDGEPKLGVKGFHFCTELQDVVKYYCYSDMRVFEIEADGIITNAKSKCSKKVCSELKLIREISLNEVAESITKSELAYEWALYIGNLDIMIDKITDSEHAYYWARDIGNRNVMTDIIKNSEYAYLWAINIGNRDIMIGKIVERYVIHKWLDKWPDDKQYFIDKGLIK